jgi:ABC-type lipoprotein release transport system permease subunit
VAILEPGRKRRRRATRRQVIVPALWGVALAVALLIVVGELI